MSYYLHFINNELNQVIFQHFSQGKWTVKVLPMGKYFFNIKINVNNEFIGIYKKISIPLYRVLVLRFPLRTN